MQVQAGDVIGLRGRGGRVMAAALAAWRRGLSLFLLSDREPDARVRDLLRQAGCVYFLGMREGPALERTCVEDAQPLSLPTSTLVRTSGTSGSPRIAVHAVETHIRCARAAAAYFDLKPGDTWLLSLPLYHVGGLGILFRCLVSGATLAVPRPDEDLHAAVERYEPTHLSLVATQLDRLLDSERGTERLRACRAVLVGGGTVPGRLRERSLQAGVALHVSYGATETTAFVTASGEPEVVAQANAAGRPLPNRRIEIAEDGEILVGGDGLFDGYLKDGHVVAALDDDGMYATGDIGRMEDGVLYVDGRRDRMIVSGGENIHPEEIEAELAALEGVDVAVVVGVEDAEFGTRPVAFVKGDVAGSDLAAALRERLPGFKVPDAFYATPVDALQGIKPDVAGLARCLRDPGVYDDLVAL